MVLVRGVLWVLTRHTPTQKPGTHPKPSPGTNLDQGKKIKTLRPQYSFKRVDARAAAMACYGVLGTIDLCMYRCAALSPEPQGRVLHFLEWNRFHLGASYARRCHLPISNNN